MEREKLDLMRERFVIELQEGEPKTPRATRDEIVTHIRSIFAHAVARILLACSGMG